MSARLFTVPFSILLSALAFLSLFPPYINASEILFSDDFESGSPSKWNILSGLGSWQISTISGSQMFGCLVSPNFTVYEAVAGSTDWTDYSYDIDITAEQGADKNVIFRYKDSNNKYGIHIVNDSTAHQYDRIYLERWINGPLPDVIGVHQFYNGVPIHLRIEALGSHIRVYVDHELTPVIDAPNFGSIYSGKIGLRPGTGSVAPTKIWYDNVVVESLNSFSSPTPTPTPTSTPTSTPSPTASPISSPTPTPTLSPTPTPSASIPLFLQNDSPWGTQEYNSANKWATPSPGTIGRWGCALTSSAMVMNYYGNTKTDNNTPLDPGSLNTWLKENGGYLGNGYIKWTKVTELSRKAHGTNPQGTILGFKYGPFNSGVVETDLAAGRPDILGVNSDSHFVVATGKSGGTFAVNDPLYGQTTMANKSYIPSSVKSFYPEVDSSIISLMTISPVQMGISRMTGGSNFVQAVTQSTEGLDVSYGSSGPLVADDNSGQTNSEPLRELYVNKPPSGDYLLTIQTDSPTSYLVDLDAYNQAGDDSLLQFKGLVAPGYADQVRFSYSNDKKPSILTSGRVVTFETLKRDIKTAETIHWISSSHASKLLFGNVEVLQKLVSRGQKQSPQALAKVFKIHLDLLERFGWINSEAKNLLLGDLGFLGF